MSIQWSSEKRKICDLKLAEYNPRQASEKEVHDLTTSIERFNLADPIIINKNNQVIGGHFRIKILKDKGIAEADVRVPDVQLTEAQERELNLRLNKNLGSWDLDVLANFDEEILLDVGFSAAELDGIFDLQEGKTNPNVIPAIPKQSKTKQGDIFQLGNHRVMCGDSTQAEDVDALMGGHEADMIFTDPPYNRKGAVFYVCSGWSSYPVFYDNIIKAGFYRAGVIIWVKNNVSYGWNDYRYKHEWILVGKRKEKRIKAVSIMYGWKKDSGHFFRDTRDEYDVWEVPRVHSADMMHPTQKPIWLISKALANSSARGQNVVDLFGGVGSTLIACERLKRKCFIMEFDPKYVDVIVSRWEKYTEQKAVKLGPGSDGERAPQGNVKESLKADPAKVGETA